MRFLNSTNLIVMTPGEWLALKPYLVARGYRMRKEPGQHAALWDPAVPRCVGETLEGKFYLDARCLGDVPAHMRPGCIHPYMCMSHTIPLAGLCPLPCRLRLW
jgi:hypothetical protein